MTSEGFSFQHFIILFVKFIVFEIVFPAFWREMCILVEP